MMARPSKRIRAGELTQPAAPLAAATAAAPVLEIDEIAARCAQDDAFKLQLLAVLTETLKAAGVEFHVGPEAVAGEAPAAQSQASAAAGDASPAVRAKTQGSNGVMPIELHFSGKVNFRIGAVYTNLNTDN